jgi:hypothetical protein
MRPETEHPMDPLSTLYERLRTSAAHTGETRFWPVEPPCLEDWLAYWNDDDTDLANLRNFEHWLSRRPAGIGSS